MLRSVWYGIIEVVLVVLLVGGLISSVIVFQIPIGFTVFENIGTVSLNITLLISFLVVLIVILVFFIIIYYLKKKQEGDDE